MTGTAVTANTADQGYLGDPPLIDWVFTDRCFVDRRYQRTVESRRSQALIERISTEFTWRAFGSLIVARVTPDEAVKAMMDPRARGYAAPVNPSVPTPAEGWFYAVLDGQHRVLGVQRRAQMGLGAIPELPALIHLNMSMAEQAMAFAQANDDRVAVNPYALYHARLLAGDDQAQAIDVLCQESGLSIPRYPVQAEQLKPGETLALGTLGWILRTYDRALAVQAASAVADAWHDQPGAARAPVLKAVAHVLQRHASHVGGFKKGGPRDYAALAERVGQWLGRLKPMGLRAAALQHRAAHGGGEADAYRHLIEKGLSLLGKTQGEAP